MDNKLAALEPDNLSVGDPAWLFTLVQDLYMRKENRKQTVAIDLGWYLNFIAKINNLIFSWYNCFFIFYRTQTKFVTTLNF